MRTLQHYLQRKNETNVKMNVAKENNAVQCRSWVCSDDPVDKPCCVVSSVGIGSIISSQHWFVLLSYSPPWVSTSVVCVCFPCDVDLGDVLCRECVAGGAL